MGDKIIPEQFCYYKGVIKYHRTDDLRIDSLPNGTVVHLVANWIAEDDEKFAGQMTFSVAESPYWIPECDLILTEEIKHDEYMKALNDFRKMAITKIDDL